MKSKRFLPLVLLVLMLLLFFSVSSFAMAQGNITGKTVIPDSYVDYVTYNEYVYVGSACMIGNAYTGERTIFNHFKVYRVELKVYYDDDGNIIREEVISRTFIYDYYENTGNSC